LIVGDEHALGLHILPHYKIIHVIFIVKVVSVLSTNSVWSWVGDC